ncbi:HPr kinase/phosphorylase [Parapedomonas caeni]
MGSSPYVHGSCVAIGGRAVLLTGPSGFGKSDLALRLIDRGAMLVADDYVALSCDGDRLIAAPPPRIAGLLEVRAVGLVRLPYLRRAPVALVVDLGVEDERLPESHWWLHGGSKVPSVWIDAMRDDAPLKVEIALCDIRLPL